MYVTTNSLLDKTIVMIKRILIQIERRSFFRHNIGRTRYQVPVQKKKVV